MLKTFRTGIDGWAGQQLADGTVIWTAPTGRTYKTLPGSRIFFPAWDMTTAELPKTAAPVNIPGRTLMMPKRRHTRAANRARRIQQERELNAAQRAHWAAQAAEAAQRNKPQPDDDPSPVTAAD